MGVANLPCHPIPHGGVEEGEFQTPTNDYDPAALAPALDAGADDPMGRTCGAHNQPPDTLPDVEGPTTLVEGPPTVVSEAGAPQQDCSPQGGVGSLEEPTPSFHTPQVSPSPSSVLTTDP